MVKEVCGACGESERCPVKGGLVKNCLGKNLNHQELASAVAHRDLKDLPTYGQYLKESEKIPEWICPVCGYFNMCTCSTCVQCNEPRPKSISDPEVGDEVDKPGRLRRRGRRRG